MHQSNATYAVRKQTCLLGHSSSLCTDTDDEAALSLPMADTVTAEYHVLYSPTYRVPVLYFNAYYAGNSLALNTQYINLVLTHAFLSFPSFAPCEPTLRFRRIASPPDRAGTARL